MPMNNQHVRQKMEEQHSKSVAEFVNEKQQARAAKSQSINQFGLNKSQVPEDRRHDRPPSRAHQRSTSGDGPKASGKYSLDEANATIDVDQLRGYKFPLQNTLPPKAAKTVRQAGSRQDIAPSKQHVQNMGLNTQNSQKQPTNAFDDTASFASSMLDSFDHEQEQTVILNPQATRAEERRSSNTNEPKPESNHVAMDHYSTQDVTEKLFANGNWIEAVADERELLHQQRLYTPEIKRAALSAKIFDLHQNHELGSEFADMDDQLETPSRPQTMPPPQTQVLQPKPRKGVNFDLAPDLSGGSPGLNSAEVARKESPTPSISRPSSAQPGPTYQQSHNMVLHQKPPRFQQDRGSQHRQSQSILRAPPARFQLMPDRQNQATQREPKFAASESDVPDSSEDEHAHAQQPKQDQPLPFDVSEGFKGPSKKRSFGDINRLDYDKAALHKKKLFELQDEPYTQDPRAPIRKLSMDNPDNEMSLFNLLETQRKVSPEAQRETFEALTDEEWAQTGQWFVDKFQADLKELMQVRLSRRKVALSYESRIRQRQVEIEHLTKSLEKELGELQAGGSGLIAGRRQPGSSRSSTPKRPVHG